MPRHLHCCWTHFGSSISEGKPHLLSSVQTRRAAESSTCIALKDSCTCGTEEGGVRSVISCLLPQFPRVLRESKASGEERIGESGEAQRTSWISDPSMNGTWLNGAFGEGDPHSELARLSFVDDGSVWWLKSPVCLLHLTAWWTVGGDGASSYMEEEWRGLRLQNFEPRKLDLTKVGAQGRVSAPQAIGEAARNRSRGSNRSLQGEEVRTPVKSVIEEWRRFQRKQRLCNVSPKFLWT